MTWILFSTPETHLDMMTLDPLGLSLTWTLWSPSGYHQNRVTLFPLWDSPSAGTLVLIWAQLDLVNLLLT